MKTLKTIALISIVSVGMTSSVFASWWNPTTWRVFKRENKVIVQQKVEENVEIVSTTTSVKVDESNLLLCNGSKYNKCLEGQNFVCPTNGEDGFCEIKKLEDVKTPKVKVLSNDTAQPKKEVVTTVVKKGIVSTSQKKEPVTQATTKTCLNGVTILVSEYCKKICPDGEVVVENVACKTNIPTTITQTLQQNKTTTSQDLNKAASLKAEILGMLSDELSGQRKLLNNYTNEATRANNILDQLTNYTGGEILDTVQKFTISYRNLCLAQQVVTNKMIARSEGIKIKFENADISNFILDDVQVLKVKQTIKDNIALDTDATYAYEKERNKFDDTMRTTIPTLNLHP